MARWDVQVLGLDDGKPVASLVDAIARRLGADAAQVERLLAHAPTTLVTDLDEAAAKSLVQELRALGVRVKPRPSGAESLPPPMSRSVPPPTISRPEVVTDARATAPTMSLPIPETRSNAIDPRRSPLEQIAANDTSRSSGLELEDVVRPRTAPSSRPISAGVPGRHDWVGSAPRTTPANVPVASTPPPAPALQPTLAAPEEEAPRVFWTALPGAFLVPFRTPVLMGLIAAPMFMGAAVLSSMLGTFTAIVAMLVMTAAFVGVTLQVSHRCLWATAVGERMPASLPSDFLSEYAFPGIAVVVVQGAIGGVMAWIGVQLVGYGVPTIVLQVGAVIFALYSVVGFALAAASRSAMGFLDVARIVRILVRAPLHVAAIAIIGAIVQGGAAAIAAAQIMAVVATGGGIGSALLALAGSTVVMAFAASYGSALSATMMGMLFWARPEVAG